MTTNKRSSSSDGDVLSLLSSPQINKFHDNLRLFVLLYFSVQKAAGHPNGGGTMCGSLRHRIPNRDRSRLLIIIDALKREQIKTSPTNRKKRRLLPAKA